MERVGILVAIFLLALAGALVHDGDTAGEPQTRTIAGGGEAGAELAADPLISRCVTRTPGDPGQLPRVEDLDQLVLAVSGQMVGIRELAFSEPVDAEFLASRQIERRITELVAEETRPREIRAEGEALRMLGAIEPDTDYEALGEQALTSQVAGLYVPRTEELLVRADGELGAVELVTLAHELEHALADQALGIPLPDGRVAPGRSDAVLARQALVEGDATLAMTFYQLGALGPEAQLGLLLGPEGAAAQRDFERLPDFLQRQLLFPYTAGLRYACELYVEGGWAAVDRAYERPPDSTGEILYGDRAADPGRPAALGDPGEDWRSELDDQFGVAPLDWLLAAPGGDPEAALEDTAEALRSVSASRIELWRQRGGEAVALGLSVAGDGEALCEALAGFEQAAFPERGEVEAPAGSEAAWEGGGLTSVLACDARSARLAIAPSEQTAGAIAAPTGP